MNDRISLMIPRGICHSVVKHWNINNNTPIGVAEMMARFHLLSIADLSDPSANFTPFIM